MQIYYFSGTGNARAAAERIASNALDQGIPAEVFNIPKIMKEPVQPPGDGLIGFCYPTHGFNAPPTVLKFLFRFPQGQSDVFLLNTRAGMKLFKLHTMGLSGLAQLLPALILKWKGYRIIGFRPLDLPSNWISLHPGLRKKVVNSLKQRCMRTVDRFSKKILQRKRVWRGWLDFPLDLAIAPVGILYYLYGRFALTKTYMANSQCNLCMKCIRECPVKAIKLLDNRPFWTRRCESCMHCMNHCPERAIETPHFFVIPLFWLAFWIVPELTAKLFIAQGWMTPQFYMDWYRPVNWILIFLLGLFVVFAAYRLLHFLVRYKWLNNIFTLGSLTHYRFWRRYRYPG